MKIYDKKKHKPHKCTIEKSWIKTIQDHVLFIHQHLIHINENQNVKKTSTFSPCEDLLCYSRSLLRLRLN